MLPDIRLPLPCCSAVLSALAASLPGLKRLSLAMCLLVRPAFLNVLAPLVNLRELDMEVSGDAPSTSAAPCRPCGLTSAMNATAGQLLSALGSQLPHWLP